MLLLLFLLGNRKRSFPIPSLHKYPLTYPSSQLSDPFSFYSFIFFRLSSFPSWPTNLSLPPPMRKIPLLFQISIQSFFFLFTMNLTDSVSSVRVRKETSAPRSLSARRRRTGSLLMRL